MDNSTQPGTDLQGGIEPSTEAMPKPQPIENTAYGPDGKLTRKGMEAIIRSGGSVSYGNSILWTIESLPTEMQLAEGDAVKQRQVAANIQAQIAALQAQLPSGATPNDGTHQGHLGVTSTSPTEPPAGVGKGGLGEGDTAGMDGDAGDPSTPAGKAAQEASDKKAAAEKIKAEADAAKNKGTGAS